MDMFTLSGLFYSGNHRVISFKLQPSNILVSFDVVSQFTIVPVKESRELIKQIFSENVTITLFYHMFTTTYCQWNNTVYKPINGVAMGSPLSAVIANFYMEFLSPRYFSQTKTLFSVRGQHMCCLKSWS